MKNKTLTELLVAIAFWALFSPLVAIPCFVAFLVYSEVSVRFRNDIRVLIRRMFFCSILFILFFDAPIAISLIVILTIIMVIQNKYSNKHGVTGIELDLNT